MRHFPQTRALFVFLTAALLTALFVPAPAQVVSDDQEKVQHEIERAKIFREAYPVIAGGDRIGDFGRLANRRGRAQVIFLEENRALVRIEKSCGRIMVGDYLQPFEEKETLLGKDIGYEAYAEGTNGRAGTIVYPEREYNQIGSGGWGIGDLGEEDGIQVGQQLTICRKVRAAQTLAGRGVL